MPILKPPRVQLKNETLQLRVSQDLKFRLMCYADFIHATAAYVVSEALERLFRKDGEFQEHLAHHELLKATNRSEGEAPTVGPRLVE
jgi:hypothetical protein